MKLIFNKSQSNIYPELIDENSSKVYTYIRKNVKEVEVNEVTMYEYDESKLTKEEYKQYIDYLNVINLEKMRADIDYIAFMSDVDLEEGE